jgi:hypothetical protein
MKLLDNVTFAKFDHNPDFVADVVTRLKKPRKL